MSKRIIVTGAGGMIGSHLVKYLKKKGDYVIGVDVKHPEWGDSQADEFIIYDLRFPVYRDEAVRHFEGVDEVYHLAADMGGIGYIETHKADIVFNNTLINLHMLATCNQLQIPKLLFTSSACIYPAYLQKAGIPHVKLKETHAYPAQAEDGYGWEKLMMERNCRQFMEDYELLVYIARLHNIYGEYGTYEGGREKSPAALCRKVALAKDRDSLEIWGDGTQVRSYCHVSDCVRGLYMLMQSSHHMPLNIGTDHPVSIDELADTVMTIASKELKKSYVEAAPMGVQYRNADIQEAKDVLGWYPEISLCAGLERTYKWIKSQVSQ